MVRAKFKLNSYETFMSTRYDNGKQTQVESRNFKFSVVTSQDSEENKQFFTNTPGGSIELRTVNPTAWEQFELNKEYYIDFTPAEEANV